MDLNGLKTKIIMTSTILELVPGLDLKDPDSIKNALAVIQGEHAKMQLAINTLEGLLPKEPEIDQKTLLASIDVSETESDDVWISMKSRRADYARRYGVDPSEGYYGGRVTKQSSDHEDQ